MFRLFSEIVGYLTMGGVAIGAIVTIAWGAFKVFSQKWLESHFASELAKHQHGLDRQLELARSQFAASLDRATKLHAKEFETLPEAWALLCTSLSSSARLLSPMQQHPDAGRVEGAKLDRLLDVYDLDDDDKSTLRSANRLDRQKLFTQFVDRERFRDASEEHRHFNNYIVTAGVFIEPALLEKFNAVSKIVSEALLSYRIFKLESEEHVDWNKLREASDDLTKARSLQDEIQNEIGRRLWQPIEESPRSEA